MYVAVAAVVIVVVVVIIFGRIIKSVFTGQAAATAVEEHLSYMKEVIVRACISCNVCT